MDKIHILAVEDSPDTQDTLKVLIEGLECNLTVCPSAEEALIRMQEGLMPDLILLDFKLPGMNGPQFLERIRQNQNWRTIAVVPYTAQWNDELEKPFQKDLQILSDWISARKFNEEINGGKIEAIVPKIDAMENTTSIPGKLIIQIAAALIDQKKILPSAFEQVLFQITS